MAATVHTVFSIERNPYCLWQARLLAHSHRKAGQPGPLTALVAAAPDAPPVLARTFRHAPHSPHPATGDDYGPYNKPASLVAWLRDAPPPEETILVLDPDCVFVAPALPPAPVARGRPVAQPSFFLDLVNRPNPARPARASAPAIPLDYAIYDDVVRRHCARPALVEGVSVPFFIHRDDLAAVAPLWLAKTEAIRADAAVCARIGWCAEMLGYICAAAEIGLRHVFGDLAVIENERLERTPIVHYAFEVADRTGGWYFHKRKYAPWARVPEPPPDVPDAARAAIALLNELAARLGNAPDAEAGLAAELAAAAPPLLEPKPPAAAKPPPALAGMPPWQGRRVEPVKREKRPFGM
jgi:hypothetical protein